MTGNAFSPHHYIPVGNALFATFGKFACLEANARARSSKQCAEESTIELDDSSDDGSRGVPGRGSEVCCDD